MYKLFTQKVYSPPGYAKKLLLVMRLIIILLTTAILQVSASGFAQKVSVKERKAALSTILTQIKAQTGYDFIYDEELLKLASPITIDVVNTDLKKVLDICLANQDFTYAINGKTIVIKEKEKSIFTRITGYFSKMEVKGSVIDEHGNALPGATVAVKGEMRSVLTDAEGKFILQNIDEDAILTISYIGYQRIEVAAKSNLNNIRMSLVSKDLEEVTVSTGYQNILKERAPGAFDKINSDVLEKRPASNLSSSLQGLVAGMQAKENADGSVQFLIRGNSSLYAERRPLVVIDGFPVNDINFSSLNPNDVESVTILKDAAAASIWGARSGNGVVVIVTKKGKNKGLNIEGSIYTKIAKETDLNQLLTQASSKDQVAYERLAYENGWFFNKYASSFNDIGKPLTLAQELLFANSNGKISTDRMNASLDSLSAISNTDQVNDLLLQRAIQNQYNINFSSATERSNSYISLLFENNQTRYKGSDYKRYGMNFNNEYKLTSFLTFNFGLNLQYRNTNNSGATISEIQQLSPYETLLNPDGAFSVNLNNKNREQLALLPLSKFPYSDWNYNLLREVNGRKFSNEDINARFQTGFNVKLLKGLNFSTKFQYERRKLDGFNYYNDDTFYVRDMVNTMVEYTPTTTVVGRTFLPKGGIETSNKSEYKGYVFRNQLNYSADLGSRHSINALAGMEISQSQTDTRLNPWQYGYFPDKLQATTPIYGYGSTADLFRNFQGQNVTLNGGNTTLGYNLDRYLSYYANAAYTYNNKYTLSGSIRSDASNFITDDPELRWSPLWSIGALWNIRKEPFMQNVDVVDQLNMRLTYGKNGNVENSSSTKAIITVSTAPNTNTGTIIASISDYGNPSLRWEKTVTTNLGIDFSLFNQKLMGKVDIYNKIGKDITGVIALPAVTGTSSQRFNNAGITNRGIEIELGTSLKLPSIPVYYSSSFTYAYNKNRVNDLYSPVILTSGYLSPSTAFVEGRPINPVYSFTYAGMDKGIPQILGPDGTPLSFNTSTAFSSNAGLQFLNYEGTATPPHTLGWMNSFKFKNFGLSFLLIGKMGGVYRNPTFNYSATVGSTKTYVNEFVADVLSGRSDIPSFANKNESQLFNWDRYAVYLNSLIESSSYIEVKELTLDYTLPKNLTSKIKSQNIRIFAQSRDLGLLWAANKKGYNPDWLPGSDRPLTTFTFGLNVKF